MITTLHIKNIGIIEDVTIDFKRGFNVLTGETGAGKTLMIDSLLMISGGRFSKEMIRKGAKFSLVEACIYAPEHEISEEDNIIVSREIHTSGKNLCKINGRMVTVQEMRDFMQDFIDIHGQHDNQKLMDSHHHISYLDDYIAGELFPLKESYADLFKQYSELKLELKKNFGNDKERQRTLDLLYYQLNEIEEASLVKGEEETLETQSKRIQYAQKIADSLIQIENALNTDVLNGMETSIKYFGKIDSLDKGYAEKLTTLQSMYYEIQEIGSAVNDDMSSMEFNEKESDEIQKRLDTLYCLKRKYGNNIEEILNYKIQVQNEIHAIENLEEYNNSIKEKLMQVEKEMSEIATKIHHMRTKFAVLLEKDIHDALQDLEMKHASFKVRIEKMEDNKYNSFGIDQVEFLLCTNLGGEEKPLTKIASGGELSRIMLAIKTVLAAVDQVPVMIFDEIDTGISGTAAKAVSEKIKKIAGSHQIICITHLAVLAAKADHHYFISKSTCDNMTKTNISLLDEEDTVKEIARISTGQITKIAIEHAMELRNA